VLSMLEAITIEALHGSHISTDRDQDQTTRMDTQTAFDPTGPFVCTYYHDGITPTHSTYTCSCLVDEHDTRAATAQGPVKKRKTDSCVSLHDKTPATPSVSVHTIPYIRIDGSSGREAALDIQTFASNPTCKVAILSILAAGSGIEMQSANHVLFVELSFNADDLLQAEARALRIGQTRQVYTTYLLAEKTVEEDVFDIVKCKLQNISKVLENTKCTFQETLNSKKK
jgi:hypothetical protein